MSAKRSNNQLSSCDFFFFFLKKNAVDAVWWKVFSSNYVKYKRMSVQPVSAVSMQNLGNKSRVRPGSLEFVVMFRAPGGIWRWKGHWEPPHVLWKIPLVTLCKGPLVRLLMEVSNRKRIFQTFIFRKIYYIHIFLENRRKRLRRRKQFLLKYESDWT